MKRFRPICEFVRGEQSRTMLDEFNDVELSGAELPSRPQDDQYMFPDAKDVDMDAYCSPDVDVLKLGCSVDEHSYFGEVASRLGLSSPDSSASDSSGDSPES